MDDQALPLPSHTMNLTAVMLFALMGLAVLAGAMLDGEPVRITGSLLSDLQDVPVSLFPLNQMLEVQFLNAVGVNPVAEAPGRVVYNDLWAGVSMTYESAPGLERSNGKSVYTIAPGADPGQIRLRYNAPVEVQPDGSLRIRASQGDMLESAPLAWQEINGQRVIVPAAFIVSSAGEGQVVAFGLGEYHPAYPLVIDPVYRMDGK